MSVAILERGLDGELDLLRFRLPGPWRGTSASASTRGCGDQILYQDRWGDDCPRIQFCNFLERHFGLVLLCCGVSQEIKDASRFIYARQARPINRSWSRTAMTNAPVQPALPSQDIDSIAAMSTVDPE